MFGKLENLPKPAVKVTQELLNSTRVGTGRELWNNNSAELAVIPVASLSVAAEASPGTSLPKAAACRRPCSTTTAMT